MRRLFLLLLALAATAHAQFTMKNAAGDAPGPWLFGTIGVGKGTDGAPATTALKGLALKLGPNGEAGICYDLDLCRVAGAWTGGKFVTPMNLMSRGEYPTAKGDILFTTPETAGFLTKAEPWRDPREEPFGPLPEVRYRGTYFHGQKAVLKWQIGDCEIVESPSFEHGQLTRTLEVGPSKTPLYIALTGQGGDIEIGGRHYLHVPPHDKTQRLVLVEGAAASNPADLRTLTTGGPARWPEPITLAGTIAPASDDAYVVDTIPLPEKNPWDVPMFIGGFDFFPDGRAAVCTFHGDVFIVSGLDTSLEKVTWRRFASGLYHALGLKVVKGEIYVTGRDGITRLRDLNGDGEADFYEAFSWDVKVTKSFHEFVFDLQTDPEGNFYFAKAGPVKNGGRGFDRICSHHGTVLRVTPDGQKLSVFATGFRAPNGLGAGPNGEITSGDNEGTWTPVCKINWINPMGFYGVVDLAHWPKPPTDYDRPLCWLPKRVDNSSGGQVWVTSDKWGPWQGRMLHLSYGQCALYGVMAEGIEIPDAPDCCSHLMQGGVVKFPLKFQSGIMRARFHPKDGQLYVAGLRGWQTSALKNGCLQRVRYTGKSVAMPIELSAKKDGIELKFTSSLDTQLAADPESWTVEVWNYLWSGAYGSPELTTLAPPETPGETGKQGEAQFTRAQMSQPKHDPLVVKAVRIGTDDRTVFLEIPGLKPVMQMSIKYDLKTADGQPLTGEVVNTIHAMAQP